MKRHYLSLLAGIATALIPLSQASAQATRDSGESAPSALTAKSEHPHFRFSDDILLTAKKRGLEARSASSTLKSVSNKAKTPAMRNSNPRKAAPSKASALGSAFYGYRTYTNDLSSNLGWAKIEVPTVSLMWESLERIQGNGGGFVRDGKVYNFFYEYSSGELIDCGLIISDFNTGKVEGNTYTSFFDWSDADVLKKVVYRAVYDEDNDEVYVVTSNKNGNGDILQKFNPKTFEFTDLGISVAGDWVAFAWHPVDKTIYMFDGENQIHKLDKAAKKFNYTGSSFSYPVSGYEIGNMTYSPKDNAFFTLIDTYYSTNAGGEEDATDALLLKENGSVTYLATCSSNDVWSILYCPDAYIVPTAPNAPTLNSINVEGESTTGTITVTLPSTLGNGSAIGKTVYLKLEIDGTSASSGSAASGQPGTTATINISTTEGLHRITLTPYILSDDGYLYGTPLVVNKFFGHDTPAAPANVKLADKLVTWNPVTLGANEGYIDASGVTYEVSIDGVVMTTAPISGTSFSFSALPASSSVSHTASVVAIENGHRSEPGVSAKYYQADGPLSVPCYLGLEDGAKDLDQAVIDMFTIIKDPLNTEPLRGWRYDDQAKHTGGFYCLSSKEGFTTDPSKNDEYLFLPPITFTDTDAYYRLTFEVSTDNDHPFSTDETYEVVIAPAPGRRATEIIRQATVVAKRTDFETSETLFKVPEAGDWYIGIHYITDPTDAYRLYARNFLVEETNSTDNSPAAVTDLEAEGSARGALSAEVTFVMPTTNISGVALKEGTQISAEVSTQAGKVTVNGTPGQNCKATVPAFQGSNVVQVITSIDGRSGLLAETTVYVGVYRPSTPIVDYKISADNSTIVFEIEVDQYNDDGNWTGADDCDIVIYRPVGDTWREAANIGTGRTWTFEIAPNSAMDLYQFGIAAKNVVGFSEYMNTIGVVLGKPYTLPMTEDFTGKEFAYEPLIIEHISYLPGNWGVGNPAEFDEQAAIPTNSALMATWESDTQVSLPKFSTAGYHNVKADFEIFFGDKFPKLITIYASSKDVTYEPIASFNRQSGQGWQHMLVNLPAEFQNQDWVELKIRVQLEGYSSYFMLGSYSIANYPEKMVTITSVKGDTRAVVGEKKTISFELANAGVEDVAMPAYELTLIGDNGVIEAPEAVNPPASIGAYKTATLAFEYTPKVAHAGNVLVKLSLAGQPEQANSDAEHQITVFSAPLPLVDDLTPSLSDDHKDVILEWSDAVFTESFEAAETWSYGKKIREFTNVDADGGKVWGITEFSYPGKGVAKGFQVFSSLASSSAYMKAHSGEQFLMAMSTTSGETSDWLISPEVKGGSAVSFWMNVLDPQYPETIFVMYSTTGTDPDDFTMVSKGGYICPEEAGWQQYSVKLPSDAKYFALWHYGDNGYEMFGCLIDDIKYEAAAPTTAKESYNVYRNGELIANVTEPGYVDKGVAFTDPVRYYVTTVGSVNGEKAESDRSNVVWVDESTEGVESPEAEDASGVILGGTGKVMFVGFEAGAAAYIYSLDGIECARGEIAAPTHVVNVAPGVYVAKCNGQVAKVIVR